MGPWEQGKLSLITEILFDCLVKMWKYKPE